MNSDMKFILTFVIVMFGLLFYLAHKNIGSSNAASSDQSSSPWWYVAPTNITPADTTLPTRSTGQAGSSLVPTQNSCATCAGFNNFLDYVQL